MRRLANKPRLVKVGAPFLPTRIPRWAVLYCLVRQGSVLEITEVIMRRFFVAAFVALTVVAMVPTSASAFRCLARGSNGVATWGYGVFFGRAKTFALRHCARAGGINCSIAYCR